MDPIPYTSFWKAEPERQKKAWRPTDWSRRRLFQMWIIQGLLFAAIIGVVIQIAKESKNIPPIFAKLPNGVVFEATARPLKMDRIARVELVNNILPILYYQEGSDNYLETVKQNVKKDILNQLQVEMQSAAKMPTMSVFLTVIETFQSGLIESHGLFEAMTKGELYKRNEKESTSAPIYIRTRWVSQNGRYVLYEFSEVKPSEYSEKVSDEKERLKHLSSEELEREIKVKKNQDLKIAPRKRF